MTFNVFPEYLIYLAKVEKVTSSDKLHDAISGLRNIYVSSVSKNQGVNIDMPHLVCPFNDDDAFPYSYKIATCLELRKVIRWAVKNIVFESILVPDMTIWVRVRIFAGMLNNLQYSGHITHFENMFYHGMLVENVGRILDTLNIEDLPF